MASDDPELVAFYARLDLPATISRRQFFQGLAQRTPPLIAEEEALAAVTSGTIPAGMAALVAQLPAGAPFEAKMRISGDAKYHRHHPFTEQFAALYGWTPAMTDEFWVFCAGL